MSPTFKLLGTTLLAGAIAASMTACSEDLPTGPDGKAGAGGVEPDVSIQAVPANDDIANATGPSLALTTRHFNTRTPIEDAFVTACTGELVTLVGVMYESVNIVSEPGNDNHIMVNARFHATGTGETSGARYVFRDNLHFSFNTPSGPAPHGTITQHGVGRVVAQGSLENEFLHFDTHLVYTGQGDLMVTVDHFTYECRA
jgi:hypothetical protein